MCNNDVIILSRRHYGVVALADVTMSSGLGYGLGWQIAGTVAIAAATGYSLLPVTLPKFTKRFYAKYSKETNEPLPIDDGDLQLVASVLNKLNFPEHKSAKLDFYVTDTFYPRHQGCLPLDCFSLIGIPFTFKWKSADDFEAAKGDLIKRNFPWEEPLASKVAAALLLTDSEKEFLIAQQLGYLDSQQVIVNLFFQVFFIVSSFIAAHLLNYRKGSKGNQTAMGVTYLTSSLVAYLCYVVISDSYNCYLDQYADKYAATISPELSQAGCEYYNKNSRV
ncbi:hypothetical protein EB796_003636 [Bugula neritina]|uniref:Uncharacterized protein n=1 Tax=Bugula neritina TaxID=10212 RepID=A0A7J7KJJ9_BUGNE|nr:hypothetical protein EB796_003636 [Bugula neritina]